MHAKARRKALFVALLGTIGFGAIFSAVEKRTPAPAPAPVMLAQPQTPAPAPAPSSTATHAKPVTDSTCHIGPRGGRYRLVHGKKRYDC